MRHRMCETGSAHGVTALAGACSAAKRCRGMAHRQGQDRDVRKVAPQGCKSEICRPEVVAPLQENSTTSRYRASSVAATVQICNVQACESGARLDKVRAFGSARTPFFWC